MKAAFTIFFCILSFLHYGQGVVLDLRAGAVEKPIILSSYEGDNYVNTILRSGNNWDDLRGGYYADSVSLFSNLKLDNIIFRGSGNFTNVHFKKETDLSGVTFLSGVDFTRSVFSFPAFFNSLHNAKTTPMDFTLAKFESVLVVDNSIVPYLRFVQTNFGGPVRILQSKFDRIEFYIIPQLDNLDIDSVVVKQDFRLKNATVKELAIRRTIFEGSAMLQANFQNALILKDVTFMGTVDFSDCVLPSSIWISDVKTNNIIDLTKKEFSEEGTQTKNKKTHLYISNTDIDKIKFDYTRFKLMFKDPWGRQLPENERQLLYERLLKKFKEAGEIQSYQNLDIEYQEYADRSNFKYRSSLNRLWWNFGYNKEYIVWNTLSLLLVFSFFTYFMLRMLQTDIYPLEAITRLKYKPSIYKHGGKRIWFSIVYTAMIFFLLTFKVDRLQLSAKPLRIAALLYLILIHVAGLLCLGFIVNFILQ